MNYSQDSTKHKPTYTPYRHPGFLFPEEEIKIKRSLKPSIMNLIKAIPFASIIRTLLGFGVLSLVALLGKLACILAKRPPIIQPTYIETALDYFVIGFMVLFCLGLGILVAYLAGGVFKPFSKKNN